MKLRKVTWMAIFLMAVGAPVARADNDVPEKQKGQDGWLTDFEAAKKTAAEKKVPILADFAGSDWCGWCIKLDKEVFSTEEFKAFAKDKFVLFLADFPSRKKQDKKVAAQNKDLAARLKVQGFPTVLLLDAKGDELARTGYRPGGPEAYIDHLKGLLAEKK